MGYVYCYQKASKLRQNSVWASEGSWSSSKTTEVRARGQYHGWFSGEIRFTTAACIYTVVAVDIFQDDKGQSLSPGPCLF